MKHVSLHTLETTSETYPLLPQWRENQKRRSTEARKARWRRAKKRWMEETRADPVKWEAHLARKREAAKRYYDRKASEILKQQRERYKVERRRTQRRKAQHKITERGMLSRLDRQLARQLDDLAFVRDLCTVMLVEYPYQTDIKLLPRDLYTPLPQSTRLAPLVAWRAIIWKILRRQYGWAWPRIAACWLCDHTTVMNGVYTTTTTIEAKLAARIS